MKKLLFPIILIILSLVLAACGDDDEVTDPNLDNTGDQEEQATEQDPEDDATTDDETVNESVEEEGTQEDGADLQDRYNFIEFNLEADIDNQDEAIDVEFDADTFDVEAKYVDQTQGIDLRGDEAMEELDSIFMAFRFDQQSTDEEILDEVLEAFNIPDTATEVEIEIEFLNGVEKEFER